MAVSDGGNGGSGGNAGTVSVTNASSIITGWMDPDGNVHGHDSAGILAQSIGGGGGNGAFSVSGAVGLLCAPSLSFGGSGAGGGNGAAVTINNTGAAIITLGDRAAGIFGQSVGGGGGNGGFSVAGGLSCSLVDLALTYGSNGGFGGNAGAVTINSGASTGIATSGNDSQAILAQSIGGGGGNGAFSVAGDLTLVGVGVGLSFGSNGGSGGSGGAVTVTDTGSGASDLRGTCRRDSGPEYRRRRRLWRFHCRWRLWCCWRPESQFWGRGWRQWRWRGGSGDEQQQHHHRRQ